MDILGVECPAELELALELPVLVYANDAILASGLNEVHIFTELRGPDGTVRELGLQELHLV